MALKKYRNIDSEDRVVSDIQKNTSESIDRIATKSIVDGVLLRNISMSSTTRIEHKLSRIPLGWIVVRSDSDANYWDSATVNNLQDKFLIIDSSVSSSMISLWVF